MTELEKIAYAKTFIDKLANGINPLNNANVSEGDIVNNVRLSRCFFYVSDILRQVIDNGGIKPEKKNKTKKLPFSITYEERAKIEYSETPITITKIESRINSVAKKDNTDKFPRKNAYAWMLHLGILKTEITSSGRKRKRPTEAGKELGITIEYRDGQYGSYEAVVFDINAQHFIIDNLDAILAFEEKTEEKVDKIN